MYWGVYEQTRVEAFSKAKNHPQALRHIRSGKKNFSDPSGSVISGSVCFQKKKWWVM